jgi:hypothetical protein
MKKLALTFLVLFLTANIALAQHSSLKNLNYLSTVLVESFPKALKNTSLSKRQIKNDIELKLRQNGIKISKDSTASILYLNINAGTIKYKDGTIDVYYYGINLTLEQATLLSRDLLIKNLSTTWHTGGIGFANPSNVRQDIRDFIDGMLNRFLNDYLAANPK